MDVLLCFFYNQIFDFTVCLFLYLVYFLISDPIYYSNEDYEVLKDKEPEGHNIGVIINVSSSITPCVCILYFIFFNYTPSFFTEIKKSVREECCCGQFIFKYL